MERHGGRGKRFWVVLCAAGVIWFIAWVVVGRKLKVGEVDAVSATIGFPGMVCSVYAAWMMWNDARRNVEAVADRLAIRIEKAESEERFRLLGGGFKSMDLRFVLRPAPVLGADGADPEGTLKKVVGYYDKLDPGRLVITGAPGSGKTVLALELVLALLKARKRDSMKRVPVRMSLASWTIPPDPPHRARDIADAGAAVEAWVCDHLERVYQLSSVSAWELVRAGKILPVLDGLDEMDAADTTTGGPHAPGGPRARRALETLNLYGHNTDPAPVVLTCRSGPYEALDVWAMSAARVEITRVSPAQAREFIHARVGDRGRWREVVHALDTDPSGTLARNLSTPWRLTMAVTVHEQRHLVTRDHLYEPRDLLVPALANEAAMRDHLNRLYVQTAPDRGGRAYTPQQIHAWLHVLARYLDTNTTTGRVVGGRVLSGTDLVPHELWPLARRDPRTLHTVLVFITTVLLGLVAGTGLFMFLWKGPVPDWQSPVAMFCCLLLFNVYRPRDWPRPTRLDLGQLRTPQGQRKALAGLALGIATGIAAGIAITVAFGFADQQPMPGPKEVLSGMLGGGIVFGLPIGLTLGFTAGLGNDGGTEVKDPRDVVRADLRFGRILGIMFGTVLGIVLGIMSGNGNGIGIGIGIISGIKKGNESNLGTAIAAGILFGFFLAFTFGLLRAPAAMRYFAFLLCVRVGPRALPWRLGRFLHWATKAELLRTSGIAYQFRHRELQDWLARNPTPPT